MCFFPCDVAAPVPRSGPVVDWEEPNCPLCGSRHWSTLVEAPDSTPGGTGLWFAVVQCQDCGLCFTNPRPNELTIGQFYPATYRPHRAPSCRKRARLPKRRLFSWRQTCKERDVLPRHGRCRLLDFGCGGGSFLERMHRQGWQVTGIDVSPEAVHRIRSELALDALVGTLPHRDLQPESFDVITMWHSLEHVHAPRVVLREVHRLLAPGGKLLVAVPNIDSLPFRWFGRNWFGLDLPRHLTHFAPWTLQLMLERTGFRVEPIRQIRHAEWLCTSARRAGYDRGGPHWHRWLTLKPAARLATWYSYLTQQCDCMMATAEKHGG